MTITGTSSPTVASTESGSTAISRVCAECDVVKVAGEFYQHKNGTFYTVCKPCHYTRTQAWRQQNIDRIRQAERDRYAAGGRDRKRAEKRLRKYGITADEYDALLAAQNHVCPICTLPFAESVYSAGQGQGAGSWDLASVDHDHATGAVRGILHRRCNLVLEFGFTPADMERAQEYTERHGGQQ